MHKSEQLKLCRYGNGREGVVEADIELKGLVTALLFLSPSTKSREFARQMCHFYEAVNSGAMKRLELVVVPNVSGGEEANEEKHGKEHGNWLYAMHDSREGHGQCPACKLQRRYKLHDAPYLALIRPNGDVFYTSGAEDVRECFDMGCCLGKLRLDGGRAAGTLDCWSWMMGLGEGRKDIGGGVNG